jgi:[ribosomal protein S18]-alanine N-acetyltransferase
MDSEAWAGNLAPMGLDDLRDVCAVESQIYSHPWTLGNFEDALRAGNKAFVWRHRNGDLVGYALLMQALDEIHLLNIGIAPIFQGQGRGRKLLEELLKIAAALGARLMLLEVRVSNVVALALYDRIGFRRIGMRKGYYPTRDGREDALVLERPLGALE